MIYHNPYTISSDCRMKTLWVFQQSYRIERKFQKIASLKSLAVNSSRIKTSPPVRIINSSSSKNMSNISENMFHLDILSSQDEYLVNILEELQNRTEVSRDYITEITSSNPLKGLFY